VIQVEFEFLHRHAKKPDCDPDREATGRILREALAHNDASQ
jgi:hypothetical protein